MLAIDFSHCIDVWQCTRLNYLVLYNGNVTLDKIMHCFFKIFTLYVRKLYFTSGFCIDPLFFHIVLVWLWNFALVIELLFQTTGVSYALPIKKHELLVLSLSSICLSNFLKRFFSWCTCSRLNIWSVALSGELYKVSPFQVHHISTSCLP